MTREAKRLTLETVLIVALLVVMTFLAVGCTPHPVQGASMGDVREAYGKPHREYVTEDGNLMWEWSRGYDWYRRAYFVTRVYAATRDGDVIEALPGKPATGKSVAVKVELDYLDFNERIYRAEPTR